MIRDRSIDFEKVITRLETLTETSERNAAIGKFSLEAPLMTRILAQLKVLKSLNISILEDDTLWRNLNRTRWDAVTMLIRTTRGFWRGLEIHVSLGMVNPRALEIFDVPKVKLTHTRLDHWKVHAERIERGAARAEELGIELHLNPSAKDVAQSLARALDADKTVVDKKTELSQNRHKRRQARGEGAHLLNVAARRIEEGHRGQPTPVVRQVMESFGFVFRSSKTETTDEPKHKTEALEGPQTFEEPEKRDKTVSNDQPITNEEFEVEGTGIRQPDKSEVLNRKDSLPRRSPDPQPRTKSGKRQQPGTNRPLKRGGFKHRRGRTTLSLITFQDRTKPGPTSSLIRNRARRRRRQGNTAPSISRR